MFRSSYDEGYEVWGIDKMCWVTYDEYGITYDEICVTYAPP